MLFDHEDDPRETKNLAEDAAYASLVEQLHEQLAAHILSVEGD